MSVQVSKREMECGECMLEEEGERDREREREIRGF